ncbi:thioredoxin family protein [Verrucomicrobiaceae bacterium 227]
MMRHLALICALVTPLSAAWLHDLEAGKKLAAEEKKDVYLIFTALKVSGACVQLEKRVLSQDAFQSAVEEKFVLVHLDVPLEQEPGVVDPLTPNKFTAGKFGIENYPTALYLNADGHPYLSETGALTGGPEKYAAHLLEKAGEQSGRDRALEDAGKLEGLERAKALIAVIESAPSSASPKLYEGQLKELADLDPDDSLGFQGRYHAEAAFRELETALRDIFHQNSYEEVVQLVDRFVKDHQAEGALLQKALFRKLAAQRHGKMTDEAIKTAEVIIETDPESSHGRLAKQILESLQK